MSGKRLLDLLPRLNRDEKITLFLELQKKFAGAVEPFSVNGDNFDQVMDQNIKTMIHGISPR